MNQNSSSTRYIADFSDLIKEYSLALIKNQSLDRDKPIQCYCPYCQSHGEPSSKPTLYLYPETMTGWCFRCHSLVLDKSLVGSNPSSLLKMKLLEGSTSRLLFQDMDISYLKPIGDARYIEYFLEKRSPKYLFKCREWNLREIKCGDRYGILIPFYYEGRIVTYQIRYIDEGKFRYKTNEGIKLPYFVGGYLQDKNYDKITLVEGIFDAMAASIFGLPNPIAVLGSQLPKHIYEIITKLLKPSEIIYAFDDMNINYRLSSKFKSYPHSISFIDTESSDLDEYLRYNKIPSIIPYSSNKDDLEIVDSLSRILT